MNKLVIFFEHGVETLTYFSRQLAEAFADWGYEVFWMDLDMAGLSAWKLRQMMPGREAVLITFNFIGLSGEEELWDLDDTGMPVTSIWEKLGILCLNIMVDHPVYYFKALRYPMPSMQVFCVDRNHVSYMKRFYPDIPCEFLPLAGNVLLDRPPGSVEKLQPGKLSGSVERLQPGKLPGSVEKLLQGKLPGSVEKLQPEEVSEPVRYGFPKGVPEETAGQYEETFEKWIRRPYDLVFTANYVPLPTIEKQFQAMEPEYRDFYYEIIDAFVRDPQQELLSCIETYLRREMPELSDVQLCSAMSSMPAVDLWVRMYFREKTVRILAESGIKVHIFGKNWNRMPCRYPQNLITSGHMVGSQECVQVMAQGKIALNTMPWFKDGAHDRIFTAMLQRAAALTDDSVYLRQQLQDMDTVIYYDLKNLADLPEMVRRLLKEPEQLYQTACRGKAAAERFHTWKCRAVILKHFIETRLK